jgi:uncharacterized membrane protein required for colicin V production
MNWVDILVLVILVIAGYKGFKSGLVRMGVFLVVMGIGLALSSRLTQPISNLLPSMSENDRVQSLIVFFGIDNSSYHRSRDYKSGLGDYNQVRTVRRFGK